METPVRANRPRMRAKTKKWMLYPTPRVAPLPRRHPLIPAAMVWMGASGMRGCLRGSGASRGEWRLEALVDFDLVAGDKLVGFIGHANDGLKLLEHGPGHAFAESGSGVRGDAVSAVVGDADGDVDHFLGEWIERARRHDLLDAFPGALEQGGIVRDGLPKIIDPIGFARNHDVVVNRAHFRAGVLVFDESECGHENLRNCECELRPQVSRNWREQPAAIGRKFSNTF